MWLAKLRRMMDELPDRFLEPEYLDETIPPNTEPVGELSPEEKRIFGVVRQIAERVEIETEARAIMNSETGHSDRRSAKTTRMEDEQDLVYEILIMSIAERLHIYDSDFIFDGNFIYPYPVKRLDVEEIRKSFNQGGEIMSFEEGSFPPDIDPKKMN